MSAAISLRTADGRFAPRARVDGIASWDLQHVPLWLEVRLAWHTEGKGTTEVAVVGRERVVDVSARAQQAFGFVLPEMPYTYHGKIVSILWSVDLVAPPRGLLRHEERLASLPIVVSPTLEPYGAGR